MKGVLLLVAALVIVGAGMVGLIGVPGSSGGATAWLFPPKVTVTGRVVHLNRIGYSSHSPLQAVKVTLGDQTVETNGNGQFWLTGIRAGTHHLLLRPMGGWWPRSVAISVGKKDTKVGPFRLALVATPRYSYYRVGRHGDTVSYRAYFWLDGSQKGLKRVKWVNYVLPRWVGTHWVANLPLDQVEAPPFCYAIFGHVTSDVLSQHADNDTVIANVTYWGGESISFPATFQNEDGQEHPADCPVPTSTPPTDPVSVPTDW